MNIQWYPGHMAKAMRRMEKDVKLCDLVIEIVDARAPYSSSNAGLEKLAANREILVLLCKADLADPLVTAEWSGFFSSRGMTAVTLDARSRYSIGTVRQSILKLQEKRRERDLRRGIRGNRMIKAMVCGIPNVGKSTFINSMIGKASAKTGDTPGVTRGGQWLNVGGEFLLLDTPGIHMPRFEDEAAGERLALIGSVNDDIVNTDELSIVLADYLYNNYREKLFDRYSICEEDIAGAMEELDIDVLGLNKRALAILGLAAKRRGCLKKKGEYDYSRAAAVIIDDFRSGRMGRISLERPGTA